MDSWVLAILIGVWTIAVGVWLILLLAMITLRKIEVITERGKLGRLLGRLTSDAPPRQGADLVSNVRLLDGPDGLGGRRARFARTSLRNTTKTP
jgi:hypothetical protein